MKTASARQTVVLLAMVWPSLAGAADRWEAGSTASQSNDDTATSTRNELQHGDVQVGHDLEGLSGTPDRDYYIVRTERWHSYEAIVKSGTMFWHRPSMFCGAPPALPVCPRFDKVSETGTVLVAGVPDGAQNHASYSSSLAVRWRVDAGAEQTAYLRAIGDTGGANHTAVDQYDVQFRDTTYAIPRFNNSGGQVTVVILQNLTARTVSQTTAFFAATGEPLLFSIGSEIPPFGQFVINTSSHPGISGASGSVLIAHNGPYGALAGKAVSLEPSTGFTFDTAMTPIPY